MVTGLPSADSLLPSIAALRRRLAIEESGFRATLSTATSTDTNVTATANGMVEVLTVAIQAAAWPPQTSTAFLALGAALKEACGKVLAQTNAGTKPKASTDAAAYALTGIPAVKQPAPATPDFMTSDGDLTARLTALDPVISAKLFQGQSGIVTVVVDGALALRSLTLALPLPPARVTLENSVVIALNLALDKAKRLFEDGIKQAVDGGGVDPGTVAFPAVCLYAQDSLQLADRVNVKRQDGTFATVVNAGTTTTNIGVDDQVGDVWSRAPVLLRDRAHVTGSVRTVSTLTRQTATAVTGSVTQNGSLLQIPRLTFSVTFPGTNQGSIDIQPSTQKTLAPGAFGDVSVKSRATLFLSTGTYFFNSWSIEPQAVVSLSSKSGQVVVHIGNGFTFRGSMIEKTGGRPVLFVGVFGTSQVALGAPFTGTLVALNALVDLATVASPGHSGAFYAKSIQVDPDNTVTHVPFSGPPALVST
jgi:DNA-binding protein YbaB